MENFKNLANAIVLQAVKDYRRVLGKLMEYPEEPKWEAQKEEIETFFKSNWCKTLTDLDCESLIEKIKEDVGYEC